VETVKHLSLQEMEAGLDSIRRSPKEIGKLIMIVQRPETDTRQVLEEGRLDPSEGLVGDNWKMRGSHSMPDGSANPDMQLNLMNVRVIALISPDKARWALAGDQLYVDLDLSGSNVPPGTRLAIGTAVIEVTAPPHLGCKKFSARFGSDAVKFVNSAEGKDLHMRGINARIVQAGIVRVEDVVRKL